MITGLPPAPIALSTLLGRVGSYTLRVGAVKSPKVSQMDIVETLWTALEERESGRGGGLGLVGWGVATFVEAGLWGVELPEGDLSMACGR